MKFADFRRLLANVAQVAAPGRLYRVELPADYDAIRLRFGVATPGGGTPYVDFDAEVIANTDDDALEVLVVKEVTHLLDREARGVL